METTLLEQLSAIAEAEPASWEASEMDSEERLSYAASRIVLLTCAALEVGASAVRIDPGFMARVSAHLDRWRVVHAYPSGIHPRVVALFRSTRLLGVRFDACAAGERVLIQGPRR